MSTPAIAPPRPRPRPRKVASSTDDTKPGSSAEPGSSKSPATTLDDEDAMFIRNKGRTAKSWKQIEQAVKKTEDLARSPTKDNKDVFELSDSNSPPPRKMRKQKAKNELPGWTKKGGMAKLRPTNDDDEDEDHLYLDDTPRAKSTENTPKGKRKRIRSRSRSLTPPPPVPFAQIQNARSLITQAMGDAPRRAPSPAIVDDDPVEIIELAPELAAIANAMKKKASKYPGRADLGASNSIVVDIVIKWLPHPEEEGTRKTSQIFKLKRTDTFEDLFEAVADGNGILSSTLVVTFNNRRVFAASTPHALSIWAKAEFEACSLNTYEYIREHRQERALSPVTQNSTSQDVFAPSLADPTTLPSDSGAESDASAVSSSKDTFKLQLRSGQQTISVTVRPTTKCSAIVATFLKKTGKPASAAKKARVEIDGEKMDPGSAIGDAELDDGDLVDIVGV